jgi:nucleoside-diphosphate-sugar epimerase
LERGRAAREEGVRKLLITGANGFIGANLCRHFLACGWDVHGLVRKTSDLHSLKGLDVKLIFGELQDPETFRIPADIDHVIHTASIVSDKADDETCRRNIYLLAVNLAQKIEEMPTPPRRLVHISTALTLGFDATDISEEKPGKPALFFAYTRYKLQAEQFLLDQWKTRGLPVVILRPGDVLGPHDRVSSVELLKACERGVPLIVGRGRHRFGYCYSGNLCQAAELALAKEGIEAGVFKGHAERGRAKAAALCPRLAGLRPGRDLQGRPQAEAEFRAQGHLLSDQARHLGDDIRHLENDRGPRLPAGRPDGPANPRDRGLVPEGKRGWVY